MSIDAWIEVGYGQKPLNPPLSLRVCRTFASRLRGFLFSPPPSLDQGLLFCYPRASRLDTGIHMLGVPFPLGVIWLDERQTVIDKRIARPWQIALIPKQAASYVIECHPQRLNDFFEGQRVDFLERSI